MAGGIGGLIQGWGNFVNGVGNDVGGAVNGAINWGEGLVGLGPNAPGVVNQSAANAMVNPNGNSGIPQNGAGGGGSGSSSSSSTSTVDPAQVAAAIEAGYGGVINTYNNELGDIPGEITDATNSVNNQYGANKGSIDTAYNVGNSNLNFARGQLQTTTKSAITKLGQQLRDSFNSYDTLIGAEGGGDSSAPGQLSYALQKVGAQNSSDITQNEQSQMGQIGQEQYSLDQNYGDQINQLNTWKSNQIISIGQQFKSMQQQIEEAKAGASQQELTALAGLNTNLVNNAISALSGVEATHQQSLAAIQQALNAGSAPSNPGALSSANYTPTALPTATTPGYASANNGTAGANPTSTAPAGSSFVSAVPYYKNLNPAGV